MRDLDRPDKPVLLYDGALARGRGWRWPLWLYRHVPLVAPVCEHVYRYVADRRGELIRRAR